MKNRFYFYLLFVLLILSTIGLGLYYGFSGRNNVLDEETNSVVPEPNKMIFESGQAVRYEGMAIPAEVSNLETYLAVPETSQLLGVVEAVEPGYRMVTLKYRVFRSLDEIQTYIDSQLTDKGWTVTEFDFQKYSATIGSTNVYVNWETESKSEQLLIVTYLFEN
jgi:hypothetical protein